MLSLFGRFTVGRGVDINFFIPQKGMWMGTSQPTGFVCWNLPCSLGIYVYFGAKYPHFAAELVSPYVDICCASAWSQLLWRTSTGRKFQNSNWFHMTYENPSYQIESFDLLKIGKRLHFVHRKITCVSIKLGWFWSRCSRAVFSILDLADHHHLRSWWSSNNIRS